VGGAGVADPQAAIKIARTPATGNRNFDIFIIDEPPKIMKFDYILKE
jgi:hypothetical protein